MPCRTRCHLWGFLCYSLAMKPEEIRKFFYDVSQHAGSLLTRYNHYLENRNRVMFKEYQKPIVTVSSFFALKLFLMLSLFCITSLNFWYYI